MVNADDVKGSSEVVTHRNGGVIIEQEDGVAADYLWMPRSACRTLRTPEQIAAEERDAAINELVDRFSLYSHPDIQWRALFAQMYDRGYRMTAEDER